MNARDEYILALARALRANGRTWTGLQLVAHLNEVGFTTKGGSEFATEKAGHGPYAVIAATYRAVEAARGTEDLEHVAYAFVNSTTGKPAWWPDDG
jgi:hypothetical protein